MGEIEARGGPPAAGKQIPHLVPCFGMTDRVWDSKGVSYHVTQRECEAKKEAARRDSRDGPLFLLSPCIPTPPNPLNRAAA
jgi:hypothetical protein